MADEKTKQYRLKLAKASKDFYLEQLQINKLNKNELIGSTLDDFPNYDNLSGRRRLSVNMQKILYGFLIEKNSYICTTFRIIASNGSEPISSIYAYLYTKADLTTNLPTGVNNNNNNMPQYNHMFYALGPTFISQDGEYRDVFMHYARLDKILKAYQNQYEIVEELILRKIESGQIDIHLDMFYPVDYKTNKNDFEEKINTSRLAIKFLVLCWITHYYKIHIKATENHMNPAYEQIIYDVADLPTFDKFIKSLGSFTKFHKMLYNIRGHTNILTIEPNDMSMDFLAPVKTCQKVFPMTVNELSNIHDINFDVWREMHITIDAFELVLNFISPSFPYLHEWFLIQNTNPNLFDNPQQQVKYERSELAKKMVKQLKDTRNLSLNDPSAITSEYRTFKDEKFEKTFLEINKPINHLNSDMILSDCSMVFHMEQVNHTWRNYIHSRYKMSKENPSSEDPIEVFTNLNLFAKYLFEIIYGLYCLNSKLGILHGDLHTNNATIFKLFKISKSNPSLVGKNPKILYILEDNIASETFATNAEPSAYLFDHTGSYSVIIDFSQSILSNRENLAGMFGEHTADVYFKRQQERVMELLHQRFASVVEKNKRTLATQMDKDLPGFIRAISALDTLKFCEGVLKMFTIEEKETKLKIPADVKEFVERVKNTALELTTRNLAKIVGNAKGDTLGENDNVEWPNLAIIREHFSNFKLNNVNSRESPESYKVIDVFVYANDLKYNSRSYENLPPLVRVETADALRKECGLAEDPEAKPWQEYNSIDHLARVEALVEQYEPEDVKVKFSWMYE